MITMKILGPGCERCSALEQVARAAAYVTGLQVDIVSVSDLDDIMDYEIPATPALVIDEKVVCYGRIPSENEIVEWLIAT